MPDFFFSIKETLTYFETIPFNTSFGGSVVQWFMGLPRMRKGHGSSLLLRFSQLSISTILNLIDAEVLIKVRIATSHCLCDARNIRAMKTHLYSQTIRYIPVLDFMGEQVITLEWTPK